MNTNHQKYRFWKCPQCPAKVKIYKKICSGCGYKKNSSVILKYIV